MKHVFDLDNTLVYTDQANNDAYNRALERESIAPIQINRRITHEIVSKVYPDLTPARMARIIANKKKLYPVDKTTVNVKLLWYVRELGKDNCVLWSGADPERAISILNHHGLKDLFSELYFSKKENVFQDLENLAALLALELRDLTVYEDTDRYIRELRDREIIVVDAKCWK